MFGPNADAITTQLTSDYAVNSLLMAWSHTLLNTSLYPVEPRPAWFDKVSKRLDAAKTETAKWLHEEYPKIAAALPQSLIDYGNRFGPVIDELAPLVAKKQMTAAERSLAVELVESLLTEARAQRWRVLGLQKKVVGFADLVGKVAAQAAVDSREVFASLGAASARAAALQTRLASLQNQLGTFTADAKNSMTGAAMGGASVTMTLMSFTISAGVGAAAFPVLGLAGAFIGIGINAAIEASKSEQVRQTLGEIGRLTVELSAEQNQAAALQVMVKSLENLGDGVRSAQASLAGSVHHWDDVCDGLGLARELLDQPAVDLTRLTAFVEVAKAPRVWATIVERAQKVQSSAMTVGTPIRLVVEAA